MNLECYFGPMLVAISVQLAPIAANCADVVYDGAGNLSLVVEGVKEPPRISFQIITIVGSSEESISIPLRLGGGWPDSFRWFHNGNVIPGVGSDILRIANTSIEDAGTYSVVLSNSFGTITGIVAQIEFEPRYHCFGKTPGIVIKGDASITNQVLRLTPPELYQGGSAWYHQKVFCRGGFTNRFQFRITTDSRLIPADGFSFVVQGTGTNLLADENGPGAVTKFDTYRNAEEPSSNFVALQDYSEPGIPYATADLNELSISLKDGSAHTVQMSHDGLHLDLWLDGHLIFAKAPMPLDAVLDDEGYAYVGFGSRSGAGGEAHDILNWSFESARSSSEISLLVNPLNKAPAEGDKAWLAAVSETRGPLSYHWIFGTNAVSNATSRVLALSGVQVLQAGSYSVIVSNRFGEVGRATNQLAVLRPITNLFNTGINHHNDLLPGGASDVHWQILPGSPGSGTPKTATQGANFPTLETDVPSAWIQPSTQPSSGLPSAYYFGTWFSLDAVQAKSASVRGRWAASSAGIDVLINGVSTSQLASNAFSPYPFFISGGFVSGSNSLVFVVTNQTPGPVGLRVELQGTTLASAPNYDGDSDQDQLKDSYEWEVFGNLWQVSTNDFDGDGISNGHESLDGTSPLNPLSLHPRLTLRSTNGQIVANPLSHIYNRSERVRLSAFPNVGAVFSRWSGDISLTNQSLDLFITSNMTVVANFLFPFQERIRSVPGRIEAEDFDSGEEGFAYHDAERTNYGDAYRDTGVDVRKNAVGAYLVGWTSSGEWLNYTINVISNGAYRVVLRFSSGGSLPGSGHFDFGSENRTLPMIIPPTGGWETYSSVTSSVVYLEAGLQLVRFAVDEAPSGFDLDSFQVIPSRNLPPTLKLDGPPPATPSIVGLDVPLEFQATDPDGIITNITCYVDGVEILSGRSSQLVALWRPKDPGTHTVSGKATDNLGATSSEVELKVVVREFGAGFLRRELFTNIAGLKLEDLTNHSKFPHSPDLVDRVMQFESPPGSEDMYGARLSGYLIPPVTGRYLFYLSSDDQGILFLSSDENPSNKVAIAFEPEYNGFREFINGLNQASRGIPPANISTPIPLEAGRSYYIEALLKEGPGADHLSVAWSLPGQARLSANGVAPISSDFLVYHSEDYRAPEPRPGILLHRYSFDERAGATVVHDSVGMAHGTVVNPKASNFNGAGQFTVPGGAPDSNSTYLELPGGIISSLASVSIEGWIVWRGPVASSWQRIFDFGDSANGDGRGYMFLTPSAGVPGNRARFALREGTESEITPLESELPLPVGTLTHFAVVYDPINGTRRLYINGKKIATALAFLPLTVIEDVHVWLGKSQFRDPYFNGSFEEFRIYDGPLSDSEVLAHFTAGPNSISTSPPTLEPRIQNPDLELSWALRDSIGFTLFSAPSVVGPWSRASFPVLTNGGKVSLVIPLSQVAPNTNQFFQLRK